MVFGFRVYLWEKIIYENNLEVPLCCNCISQKCHFILMKIFVHMAGLCMIPMSYVSFARNIYVHTIFAMLIFGNLFLI